MNSTHNITTRKRFMVPTAMLNVLLSSTLTFILSATLTMNNAYAAISATYSALPPTSAAASTTTPPLIMLVMSNDRQLFTKAYSDYNDIIDASVTPAVAGTDGILETTYTDSFDYYGYFNNRGCYTYASGKYTPTATVTTGTYNHYCADTEWSGNFLNWASMTKMDVIRKVLFGGFRSTDDANTVLERAYVPKDAHSFVKVFTTATNAEMRNFVPFSTATTISLCNVSHHATGLSHGTVGNATPPSIRVAEGDWGRWASSGGAQCEWSDEAGSDNSLNTLPQESGAGNDSLGTFIARVDVCVAGVEEDNCTDYINGGTVTKKPTGLLQDYGKDDKIKFGLISGSYAKNDSGGVLRKNIGTMSDEINSNDGTFQNTLGIINTINAFRIINYDAANNRYTDCDAPSITVPEFLASAAGDDCSNWGNPIGEMYLEAVRYFSGETAASTDFIADDSSILNTTNGFDFTLNPVAWVDPMDADNACAECSIIVISSGLNSFDMDELSSASNVPDLSGSADVLTKTDLLSSLESITGNYFVGENGTTNDGECTSKALSNLSDAIGICVEEPYAKGGYGIAGLSYHALLTDLRGFDANQNVTTYAVALSRGLPVISIPTSANDVTIVPYCQANTNGNAGPANPNWEQCTLLNLQVLNPVYLSGRLVAGTLRVQFEDSHWGFDYDMDGIEDLDFCVGTYCSPALPTDEIKVTIKAVTAYASNALRFGYTISGTTADTTTAPLIRPGSVNFDSLSTASAAFDCSQAPVNDITACTTTYTAGSTTVKNLESPLWYAAKWGGFVDVDGNDLPNDTLEWDNTNNVTQAIGSDGIPDNYFQSDNPAALESQLGSIFAKVLKRVSSGSAAAVITDSISTVGSIYQALYQPRIEIDGKFVSWAGQLHGIFIDQFGHLREDTDGNKTLTDTDEFIRVQYSADQLRTQIWYCTPNLTSSDPLVCAEEDRKEINDLIPIWNANYELAIFSATDSRLTTQRAYATPFASAGNGGRHILTWQDLDGDNVMDSGEIVDFTADNFTNVSAGVPTKAGLLDINTGTAADDLTQIAGVVNFIRGYEDPATTGYRSRTIDFLPAAGDEVWRMGDIVHSSPIAVGPPQGNAYGAEIISWETFGDTSYTNFKANYVNRRTVVYAGGNDGLIHAFNAGFYNVADQEYCLDAACLNVAASSHSLGAELWAYAPRNLLPQLKFLTEPNYPHVYYMDGEPRSFDVNIFTPDATHPDGWGTILVVGMRFGGGANAPITVDVDNTGTTTFVTGSAYVIFDVTDPEVAPKVLGEFTHPELGFTTSAPTLIVGRSADANGSWAAAGTGGYPNDFSLVFGSGPNKLSTGLSDQNAKLFMLNLEMDGEVLDLTASNQFIIDTTVANSFVGDPLAKNWNNDFLFDAVYFGISGGTEAAPDGQLFRVASNTIVATDWALNSTYWTLSTMLDSGQPFLNQPLAKVIRNPETSEDESWVYAGTGRLYTSQDNLSSAQQSFYGFKETLSLSLPAATTFSTNSGDATYLQDVTGVQVFKFGEVTLPAAIQTETGLPSPTDFDAFSTLLNTRSGWRINFTTPSSAERDLARATYFSGLIVFPTYLPNINVCDSEGNSFIYAVYERTGTGYPGGSYESPSDFYMGDTTNPESLPNIDYGFGLVSELSFKKNIDGSVRLIGTTSTGEIIDTPPPIGVPCIGPACEAQTGRQSWREILLF